MCAARALFWVLIVACSGAADRTDQTTTGTATTAAVPADAQKAPDIRLLTETVLREPLAGKRVYLAPQPLPGGTAIATWGHTQTVPAKFTRAWFVFVDDQPAANWEHLCRYVFINVADNRDFVVVQARTPPDDLSNMQLLHPETRSASERRLQ